MANEDSPSHVRIYPQCGACGFAFTPGDRIVALVGKYDSTFDAAYDAFTFPDSAYCTQSHRYPFSFCRFPSCDRCASAAESATAHKDCLLLFLRASKAQDQRLATPALLEMLWTAAIWRKPWPAAPRLGLAPDVDVSRGMRFAAKACGQLKIAGLAELSWMIYQRSQQSSLWRYTSSLDLALLLLESKQDEVSSVPIDKIHAWRRGYPATMKDYADKPSYYSADKPIIRLTVDSQGLQCIERLGGGFIESSTPRSDSTAYVVEPAEYFSDVHFAIPQPLLTRLRVPAKGFYIWDTPYPPPLQQCLVDSAYKPPSSRLTTIQTRTCTGITFFISSTGSLLGIHAHTSNQPSAQETFESLPRRQQNAVMWVYVPIWDEITAFGISEPRSKADRASVVSQTCVLVRLKLGGDVFVGPYHYKQPQRFLLTEQPLALIYEKPEIIPVSFIGIHSACHKAKQISLALPFHGSPPFEKAYFSSAPLEDVSSIRIFNEMEAQACRGIVIQYVNGSQRALGQCRVGIDRDQIVMRPRRLCLASFALGRSYTGDQLYGTKVESSTTLHHKHDRTDWACNELRGVLRFWFKNQQTKLELYERT
ncbi:hypothetical protein TOPH_03860 [Tolypocladium ophioglossoides CBS 100239]|uniref:Uncharacterized protein n=1 Tax=Tolypocladium ophioglossoides (strain CBS 100239) TaxID=1163406 RepID=A0A0L0NC29_TOLOC|nr:hypothetical protein TOPH_03860 [Tolypocladium ophioglossoides CBS 100239]